MTKKVPQGRALKDESSTQICIAGLTRRGFTWNGGGFNGLPEGGWKRREPILINPP